MSVTSAKEARTREHLGTSTDLKPQATRDISAALGALLADVFALYIKTKNFHWHMSGPHFRDYHLLLDEQSDQIFAMTDPIAERARKIGGTTIRSIGDIARQKRVMTTTPNTSSRRTCSPSSARTTSAWSRACAKPTIPARGTAMSLRPACSRCGSTRPNEGRGFSSSRPGTDLLDADGLRPVRNRLA